MHSQYVLPIATARRWSGSDQQNHLVERHPGGALWCSVVPAMAVQARQIALLLAAFSLIAVAVSGRRLLAAATPQCSRRPGRSPEQRAAQHARECSHQVHAYMKAHTADFEAEHDVKKLVFFLHVPRTGAARCPCGCLLGGGWGCSKPGWPS